MVFFASIRGIYHQRPALYNDFFIKQNCCHFEPRNMCFKRNPLCSGHKKINHLLSSMFLVFPITAFCLFIRSSGPAVLPLNEAEYVERD